MLFPGLHYRSFKTLTRVEILLHHTHTESLHQSSSLKLGHTTRLKKKQWGITHCRSFFFKIIVAEGAMNLPRQVKYND